MHGTAAQAYLLAGWLRSRLGHEVELELDEHETLDGVDLDGEPARFPPGDPPDAERRALGRARPLRPRPVYEDAVRGALR